MTDVRLRKHARRARGMLEYCASDGVEIFLLLDVRTRQGSDEGAESLVGKCFRRTLRSAGLAREVARQFPAARELLAGLPAEYVLEHVIGLLTDPNLPPPSDEGTEDV